MKAWTVSCMLVATSQVFALPQYRATLVDAPAGTEFNGMNSFGVLVGQRETVTGRDGIIRKPNGDILTVPTPSGYSGYHVFFTDINESGLIAGTLVHSFNNTGYGFVYDETTGFRIMNSDPNEAIATTSMTDDGLMAFAFSAGGGLWNPVTNEFTSIPRHGLESAISGGRATGWDWSWHNGVFTQLQGAGTKYAQAISSNGNVAGYKFVNTRLTAVMWDHDGRETFVDDSTENQSGFWSLDSLGNAVGARQLSSGNYYGTYYSPSSGSVNINSLIIDQNFPGTLGSVAHLEDNGMAYGRSEVSGEFRTVILTPVPEPGTLLALSAGLAALLRRRRRTNSQKELAENVRPIGGGL